MNQMAQHTSNLDQLHQLGEEAPSSSKLLSALLSVGVFLLLALVVKLSLWQGSYNLDPHHWGLMLSNAKDLVDGKIPYKEIFIQYGILTTLIHAFSYKYLGGNLQSIILISSIAYAIGILGIYALCLKLLQEDALLAILAVLTVVIFHPVTIYPWSNYVAFPFVAWGLLHSLEINRSGTNNFIGGFLLGLAILSREGLFLPIVLFLLFNLLIDLNSYRLKGISIKKFLSTNSLNIIGFISPILAFFAYLNYSQIFSYWHLLSVDLPKIYIQEIFPYMQGVGVITHFIKNLFKELISFNPRWYLVTFIIFICTQKLFSSILNLNNKSFVLEIISLKIAILSLFLISATLHLPEIFRVATGTIIGVVVFYKEISNLKYRNLIIVSVFLWMTFHGFAHSAGNYFLPTIVNITKSKPVTSPDIFSGQQWSPSVLNFYVQVQNDLTYLHQNNLCNLKTQYNSTSDAFLYILSPFLANQIAPMGDGPYGKSKRIDELRKDLNFNEKIIHPSNMIVLKQFKQTALEKLKQNKGFDLYKLYPLPRDLGHKYNKQDDYLGIFIPKHCNT